jgi:hypothetical protein
MPYSTHDDLKQLHGDIDELTSRITDLTFTGTGQNDLVPEITPERNFISSPLAVGFHVEISSLGISADRFKWSDSGDALGWIGQNVRITGNIQYLNYGIGIEFGKSNGHTSGDFWRFNLNPPDSNDERIMAYNWVNDRLRPYIKTLPVVNPSQTIILAEANFAVSLILRANKRKELYLDFRNEAARLIAEMIEIPKVTSTSPIEEEEGETETEARPGLAGG